MGVEVWAEVFVYQNMNDLRRKKYSLPVSVLMPVYNAQEYLVEATESILNQTFYDFEFIIIDDGSTDESLPILQRFAERDSRIRLISRPNRGLVETLNQGIALAQGEFVVRMDADDIAMADRIGLQVEYLNGHPECVAVGCSILWIDPDGAPIRRIGAAAAHDEITEILMRGRGGVCHPGAAFRRATALEVGGYNDVFEYAEDVDFFLRCGEYGLLANLSQCLLKYRQHFQSISASRHHLQQKRAGEAVRAACARRGINANDISLYCPRSRGKSETHRFWSALAQADGFQSTSRKHALRGAVSAPFSLRSWGRLVRSLSGPVFSG